MDDQMRDAGGIKVLPNEYELGRFEGEMPPLAAAEPSTPTLLEAPAVAEDAAPARPRRLTVLAVLLLVAAILIAVGGSLLAHRLGVGLLAGGVLLAGWSWLFFGEVT